MSFDTLMLEVESLPAAARRKLMAYMVALEDQGRAGYAAKLAGKIDDKSPGRWLTPEECEKKLGLTDESK
jgi:hypothetical protein